MRARACSFAVAFRNSGMASPLRGVCGGLWGSCGALRAAVLLCARAVCACCAAVLQLRCSCCQTPAPMF